MKDVLQVLEKANHTKGISFIKDYKKYLNKAFYEDNLSDALNHVLFAIDYRNNTFIHLGKNIEQIFGIEYQEMMDNGPQYIYNYFLEEDVKLLNSKTLKILIQIAKEQKDKDLEELKFAYNYRIKTPKGEVKCMLNRYTNIILGEEGFPLVIVGSMTDISEFCNNKELFCEVTRVREGRESERLFQAIFPIAKTANQYNLSKKEMEVLSMVVKGYISKEIADQTNRSVETIHSHRKNILKKMNCHNITEAAMIAKDNNWF
ncbi:hypothetical protein DNU06_05640 [Putridiphycobacter roseus]|uniref:HTH luxR-type domain-containing protein n=1 Tax=Putridiphycobacter roseus TaxID=2219161 RepID=A0A2W1NTP1_9FLAO|nr:LuxR C-terminal-related transcriptional regulator [Putridiphycobacter roseus]PZE18098.1 hypothetical protein DNU06_05640 [Putridiphycobacter roseus]